MERLLLFGFLAGQFPPASRRIRLRQKPIAAVSTAGSAACWATRLSERSKISSIVTLTKPPNGGASAKTVSDPSDPYNIASMGEPGMKEQARRAGQRPQRKVLARHVPISRLKEGENEG